MRKVVFISSFLVFAYWSLMKFLFSNVYQYAVVGAICEILWLPMIAGLLVLPLLSVAMIMKEKKGIWSLCFFSLLINLAALLVFFIPDGIHL